MRRKKKKERKRVRKRDRKNGDQTGCSHTKRVSGTSDSGWDEKREQR